MELYSQNSVQSYCDRINLKRIQLFLFGIMRKNIESQEIVSEITIPIFGRSTENKC